jgi:hypothetical protein
MHEGSSLPFVCGDIADASIRVTAGIKSVNISTNTQKQPSELAVLDSLCGIKNFPAVKKAFIRRITIWGKPGIKKHDTGKCSVEIDQGQVSGL